MPNARYLHTATLLPNGMVLVAGGVGSSGHLSSADLFDLTTGMWTNTGEMNYAHLIHTATLLPNGKVLVAGGDDADGKRAELYDPTTGRWTEIGAMNTNHQAHTATLLPNGKVLVAGGYSSNSSGNTKMAELYDPVTGMWTATGALNIGREEHTATLLPNGKVLVAAGVGAGIITNAEIYDPASGTWMVTGSLNIARADYPATLLPDGRVMVSGGTGIGQLPLSSAELYDPVTGRWTLTGAMTVARRQHTATLLPNGKTLVSAGLSAGNSAELYVVGLGFSNSWQSQITTITSPLNFGSKLILSGAKFRGISGASGGNTQDSSSDYPLVQLRSLESGQTTFLLTTSWSTNSFTSLPVWNFLPGYALATVFVNGIPSTSSIVNISVPIPTTTVLTDAKKTTNGFQFAFTNSPGAIFGVLASTNLTLPLTNWTVLGGVTEIAPGQFQFIDPQATNNPKRFFLIRSP